MDPTAAEIRTCEISNESFGTDLRAKPTFAPDADVSVPAAYLYCDREMETVMTSRTPVEIVRDQLVLDSVTVSFQRTLRIPETGLHPLPPGLGRFPLRRVADYPDTAPAEWLARGGVMLPIYQREAMWLSFDASVPAALQVGCLLYTSDAADE